MHKYFSEQYFKTPTKITPLVAKQKKCDERHPAMGNAIYILTEFKWKSQNVILCWKNNCISRPRQLNWTFPWQDIEQNCNLQWLHNFKAILVTEQLIHRSRHNSKFEWLAMIRIACWWIQFDVCKAVWDLLCVEWRDECRKPWSCFSPWKVLGLPYTAPHFGRITTKDVTQ